MIALVKFRCDLCKIMLISFVTIFSHVNRGMLNSAIHISSHDYHQGRGWVPDQDRRVHPPPRPVLLTGQQVHYLIIGASYPLHCHVHLIIGVSYSSAIDAILFDIQGSCRRCTKKLCQDRRQSWGFSLSITYYSLRTSLFWTTQPPRLWASWQAKAVVPLVMVLNTKAPLTPASTQSCNKSWSHPPTTLLI